MTECSAENAPWQPARRQVVDFAAERARLSAQPKAAYDRAKWKRSRKKDGFLIKRLSGYSIAETEYGVSYLWVLSRKPDRTTADNSVYALAGYFNWRALEDSGLLVKERKYGKRENAGA